MVFKRIFSIVVVILFVPAFCFCSGCRLMNEPISLGYIPPPSAASEQSMESRFVDRDEESSNAVESALNWSRKYEQLMLETEKLRQANNELILANKDLGFKVSSLESDLARTNKELSESNEFLQEMQLELNRWKSDVLGFREELRQGQLAQLQSLEKILKILGAEPVAPSPGDISSPVSEGQPQQ